MKKNKCKYFNNNLCLITGWKTDVVHCNSCTSHEDLLICSKCGNSIEEGKEFYHKWDIGNIEEPICEDCWNDETI